MKELFSRLPIRLKFTLSSIIILVLVSSLLLTYFSNQQEKQALALIQNKVESTAEIVGLGVGIALNSNNFQAIHDTLIWARKDENLSYILVYNLKGKEIATLNPEKAKEDIKNLLHKEGIFQAGRTLNAVYPIEFSDTKYGKLMLGYSLGGIYTNIFDNLLRGILLSAGVLLFGVFLTVVTSNVITRDIRKLWLAAEEFTHGKENVEITVTSSDEVGELGAAFQQMIETIRRNIQSLRDTNQHLGREIGERKTAEENLRKSREQLRNLSNRLQSVREEEKVNIAREIHDELGQTLSALNMDLAWLQGKIPGQDAAITSKIDSMSETIENIVQRVHQIITDLRPQILDVLGLGDALKWQTKEFQKRTCITCQFTMIPDHIELDPDRSIALFRIYQESLTNVARHAQAHRVDTRFQMHADRLELEIHDDGIGIKNNQIDSETSFGLLGMRERALVWKGQVDVQGIPGEGTTVKVIFPYTSS